MKSTQSVSLETLVHGGFFAAAQQVINEEISIHGEPSDPYRKALYSIYYRQAGELSQAKKILQNNSDDCAWRNPSALFNYVQACLFEGSYVDAIEAIAKCFQLSSLQPVGESDPLSDHLGNVSRTLEWLSVNNELRQSLDTAYHPEYLLDTVNFSLKSPSLVSDVLPRLRVVDAVYCPTSRTWYELSTNLPILELLQPSHDFSGFYAGSQPQKEIDTYRLLEDAIEIDAESLYLPATLHYGHFLTQSAAYLHPLAALPGSLCDHSITCVMSGHLPAGFQSIIEAGSCAPLKYYQIDSQPIHARKLIVSQCSWIEWHYANKVHSNLFSNATKNILGLTDDVILPSHFKHEPKKLYMSRSRLTDGLRFSVNELELERKLESLGFITVHPQELSLKELMQILQSADILVGSMGSAMHNLLFRLPSKPITVVNIAHFLPPYNFAMIEAVSGLTNSHYLRASEELKDAEGINRLYFDVPKILECVHSLIAQL